MSPLPDSTEWAHSRCSLAPTDAPVCEEGGASSEVYAAGVGQVINVTCRVMAFPPQVRYSWVFNNSLTSERLPGDQIHTSSGSSCRERESQPPCLHVKLLFLTFNINSPLLGNRLSCGNCREVHGRKEYEVKIVEAPNCAMEGWMKHIPNFIAMTFWYAIN